MAQKEDVPTLGRLVDGGTRTGGVIAVCDVILPASHNKHQPAIAFVQSPALLLPASCSQKSFYTLVDLIGSHVYPIHDRQSFPKLCRGHDHCGIMFAA